MKRREKKKSGGYSGWITTYSDLVTLLLCFFVLLYSMSQIDIAKFEALAESFRNNNVIFDRVGMYAVIDFGKFSLYRPAELLLFVGFQTLKFFDNVQIDFRRYPRSKLQGNIFMRVRAAVIFPSF